MGDFVGQIEGEGVFQIPEKLKDHIQVRTIIRFDEHDAFLLTTALFALEQEIIFIGRPHNLIPKGIILINDDEGFEYVVEDTLGYVLPLIIISLGKVKESGLSDLIILSIYLEEFFHHFLLIHDEEEVKYRVVARLNEVLTFNVEFNDVYDINWKKGYPDLYPND